MKVGMICRSLRVDGGDARASKGENSNAEASGPYALRLFADRQTAGL
jgi:hypothetical protein